ncbi:MAG: stage II sporulation protein R [Clostridiales bacterium]|nr:stage II sporulation protein R [Clostridiales bacterium]
MFSKITKDSNFWPALLLLVIGLAGFGLFVSAEAYAPQTDSLIRLHVIANSDSPYDQEVKLLIRDKVIEVLEKALNGAANKEEAAAAISQNLELIEEACREVLRGLADYGVSASLCSAEFPTKAYGDWVLPAGEYDALRIILGEGRGRNWWCVLFPPLCFVDAVGNISSVPKGKTAAAAASTAEEKKGEIVVKFKVVEFLKKK